MFTCINGYVSSTAINVYKTDLPFKQTLACDQCHGLLVASSNETLIHLFQNGWYMIIAFLNSIYIHMGKCKGFQYLLHG